jgi:hypothetical protein
MPQSQKPLDRKKRATRNGNARVRFGSSGGKLGKKTGRPGINTEQLLQDRDCVLQLLSSNWERIGWRLERARSLAALRKALRPLTRDQSLRHLIAYFLRTSTEKATAARIRKTLEELGDELENSSVIQQRCNLLGQKYDEAEAACHLASERTKLALLLELKRRGREFETCERELYASQCKLSDLETKLADQRAYFVQTELLRFKARGYAHGPKVFANAIAGLPTVGCRRSFQLCSRSDSPLWPSLHFEVFRMIQHTWKNRVQETGLTISEQFRNAILQLVPRVPVKREIVRQYKLKSKTQDNYLRTFLRENWRFLKLALKQVLVHKCHPKVVPYLITGRFFMNFAKPRTKEDTVLAEIETLRE